MVGGTCHLTLDRKSRQTFDWDGWLCPTIQIFLFFLSFGLVWNSWIWKQRWLAREPFCKWDNCRNLLNSNILVMFCKMAPQRENQPHSVITLIITQWTVSKTERCVQVTNQSTQIKIIKTQHLSSFQECIFLKPYLRLACNVFLIL